MECMLYDFKMVLLHNIAEKSKQNGEGIERRLRWWGERKIGVRLKLVLGN